MLTGSRVFQPRWRGNHDRRVVLTQVVLFISAVALLATSDVPDYRYLFAKDVSGPPFALTADAPQATYLVTLRVTGVAPNGLPPVNQAQAIVTGEINQSGVSGAFVNVSVNPNATAAGHELNAVTSFRLVRTLGFPTNCSANTNCETSFIVDFVRTDGGDGGGTIEVDWALELSASVNKGEEGPDEGPLELPWTVEITQQ